MFIDNSSSVAMISKYNKKYDGSAKELLHYSCTLDYKVSKAIMDEVHEYFTLPVYKLKYNGRLKRSMGRCNYGKMIIELQPKSSITMETLAHEIAHAYEYAKHGGTGHSDRFFRCMAIVSKKVLEVVQRMELQKNLEVKLLVKTDVKAPNLPFWFKGEKVQFAHKGQIIKGMVKRRGSAKLTIEVDMPGSVIKSQYRVPYSWQSLQKGW